MNRRRNQTVFDKKDESLIRIRSDTSRASKARPAYKLLTEGKAIIRSRFVRDNKENVAAIELFLEKVDPERFLRELNFSRNISADPSIEDRLLAFAKIETWFEAHNAHPRGILINACPICIHKARRYESSGGKHNEDVNKFLRQQVNTHGLKTVNVFLYLINCSIWSCKELHAPLLTSPT